MQLEYDHVLKWHLNLLILPAASQFVPYPMKVLIADDNAIMRSFIRSLVADISNDIHEAANGSEAVRLAQEYLPDMILMDIRMPGLDGIAATRVIMQAHAETTVVIVTEFDSGEYRKAAIKAGAAAYVLKDDLNDLPETIARILFLN